MRQSVPLYTLSVVKKELPRILVGEVKPLTLNYVLFSSTDENYIRNSIMWEVNIGVGSSVLIIWSFGNVIEQFS